ncbi:HAD family phosphatase [Aerococcus sp.]|uniref:HAD family hydrolase n=1 Tax=Aerococcus sp. TaxID=1872398 RepID=UPI0025B9973C|nr:HAD family phosphatase [Aerococcus sp.]MBR2130531.1 HAD family phosphatase [Aerococcus sp.]
MKTSVIFDMDGLMLDTEKIYAQVNQEGFESIGIEFTMDDYLKYVGVGEKETLQMYEEAIGDREAAEALLAREDKRYLEIIKDQAPDLKDDLIKVLDTLAVKNIDCYVASSSNIETVEYLLEATGIRKYFKGVLGGDQVENAKPDPEIYLKAVADFNLDKEKTIVLEDSLHGVNAAYQAGLDVIMVPDLVAPDDETYDRVIAVVGRLGDALPFID